MHKSLIFLLAIASTPVDAEVFKCIGKYGKTAYQAQPCQAATQQQQLDIKADPAKQAEAQAKLEAIQSEYESRKAAQLQADKENAEQQNQAATLEIARRNALAQQEQAEAQNRQADALERQNQTDYRPIIIAPPMYPAGPPPAKPSLFSPREGQN